MFFQPPSGVLDSTGLYNFASPSPVCPLYFVCDGYVSLPLSRTSFSDFSLKYSRDDRFKGIDKMREREVMFNDFITDHRRREKDDKSNQRDRVSVGVAHGSVGGVAER